MISRSQRPTIRPGAKLAAIACAIAATLGLAAATPAAAAPAFEVDLRREAHEQQLVFVKASAGQFRLSFAGQTAGATGSGDVWGPATGTGDLSASSATVTNVVTSTGAFIVGQTITGAGISPSTTIAAVGAGTLTLSQPATESKSSTALSTNSIITDFTTTTGVFTVGFGISGTGIAPNTTITAIAPGILALSHNASTGADVALALDLQENAPSAAVQAALNGLTNVSASGGSVSVISTGEPGVSRIVFDGGPLANSDVPQLTWTDGTTPLSGGFGGVKISTLFQSGVSRSDKRLDYTVKVKNTGDAPTSGEVTVEVELPGGLETSVVKFFNPLSSSPPEQPPVGWTCTAHPPAGAQPARGVCKRSDPLAAGASYPAFTIAAGLGADAPDHVIAEASASGGAAAPDSDTDELDLAPAKQFGVETLDSEVIDSDGDDYRQAGGHPFSGSASFYLFSGKRLNGLSPPVEDARQVITDLPRGFVGNALAVPELCPSVDAVMESSCPPGSAVGEINLDIPINTPFGQIKMPIFAIEPEFGTPAQFAFAEIGNINTPFTLTPRLRADDGYAITLDATPAPLTPPLAGANDATLCSYGAKVTGNTFLGCKEAEDPTANPVPLITNPTRCAGAPPTVKLSIDSWDNPGIFKGKESVDPSPTGCQSVDFTPEVSLKPTNKQADTPTGLDVEMTVPTNGLEGKDSEGNRDPNATSQANLANAVVTLPEGMSVNPAAAHGLSSCTPEQVKLGSNADHECPLSSQVGTIEIDTPLIQETLKGHVFMASQNDNPFDSMLGLYLVFASEKDGITIKVAGKLDADPVTGQLTSTFVENPEAPFSRLSIKFNSGPRAPLINPPKCGTYAIRTELSPWSAEDPSNPTKEEIVEDDSVYQVTSGPNGSPCPVGNLEPKLDAGLKNPIAGSKSPFVLKLTRDDGTQRFNALDLEMPQGLVAYLKGVETCSQGTIDAISEAQLTGRPELVSPACPSNSQVGTVQAGAGGGPYPFYAQGKVYLAGPYKGAPLSLATVTPAVAGPFDLGNVVVQNAVYVDPKTAKVSVKSDPIPTILHGLMLNVRDIRVNIDRPNFTAAPTNCEPKSIGAKIGGESGESVNLSNRFGVGACAALAFKPRISLYLKGGTKRGDNPALKAVVRPSPGEANIAAAAVTLPRSAFLDQAHIRTVCTRVQFAADACPAAAIYGRAEAVTPLLDQPLSGPVYLRSSSNKLPDLVADLRGPASQPIKVEVAFRTDSVRGGIRSTLDFAPDAPVTKFTLQMQGGKKGLVINSQNLCANTNRANAKLVGHNGARFDSKPKVVPQGCKKARNGKKRKANR